MDIYYTIGNIRVVCFRTQKKNIKGEGKSGRVGDSNVIEFGILLLRAQKKDLQY